MVFIKFLPFCCTPKWADEIERHILTEEFIKFEIWFGWFCTDQRTGPLWCQLTGWSNASARTNCTGSRVAAVEVVVRVAGQLPIEERQLFGWIVAWEKGPARHLAAVTAFEDRKWRLVVISYQDKRCPLWCGYHNSDSCFWNDKDLFLRCYAGISVQE